MNGLRGSGDITQEAKVTNQQAVRRQETVVVVVEAKTIK